MSSIDVTNTCERKYSRGPIDNIPLHKLVDPRFWWNQYISKPLIDKGVSSSLCEYVHKQGINHTLLLYIAGRLGLTGYARRCAN
jgi:hypothetical protein